jgi:RimJ/RimL family protein N-acetyltransferase
MFLIRTKRLLLRHLHPGDIVPMCRIFGDAEVMRFGDGVQSKEWVERWLRTCCEHYQTWGFGPYAAVERSSREVIGYCGLFYFPDVGGQPEVEIGYRLVHTMWGKGYATEAAQEVRDYAFQKLGMKRLIAMIGPSNIASLRVAEKLGMHYENDVMFEGYTHPDHVYVLARQ